MQRLEDLAAKKGRSMAQVIEDAERIDREWRERVIVCQRCGHAQEQPEPAPPVPQDEGREAAFEKWIRREAAAITAGKRPNVSLHEMWDAGYDAALSTRPVAPKDVKRYIAWLCEGCDECNPPDGSERCQGPCNSPSLNGAEVVRAEDYDRLATAEEDADLVGEIASLKALLHDARVRLDDRQERLDEYEARLSATAPEREPSDEQVERAAEADFELDRLADLRRTTWEAADENVKARYRYRLKFALTAALSSPSEPSA